MTTRRLVLAFLLVTLCSCATPPHGPADPPRQQRPQPKHRPQVRTYDARTFYETTSFYGASFSADEQRILITSDASGIYNAYSMPVTGGAPTPLTRSKEHSIFGVAYFPHDDRFLLTYDEGGNELDHLYVMTPDGKRTDLTPGKKLKAGFRGFTGDKRRFWVVTNERDPKFFDLYRYNVSDLKRERVFVNEGGWRPTVVSKDGRWLCLSKINDNRDSDLYLKDLTRPKTPPRKVTPHAGQAQHRVLSFSPDSKQLYYATDAHGEFMQAWSVELASGRHELVHREPWDVWTLTFSERGRYRVIGVNRDARYSVTIQETKTGREIKLPAGLEGDVKGVVISRSEKLMAFYVNADTAPSNLHLLQLETGEHRKLTRSLNPAIRREDLVVGRVVRYPSFDGLQIPAILYRPHGAAASRRVPALVWVHGGPGGQSRKGYFPLLQHLVNNGYAVLAVNNRGSSGYGKTFFHLDDRRHGEVDLRDCVRARAYLQGLDWIDGGRIGIIGGSYGGYMVGAALAFRPEVFDVGVDIFGVMNWVRTLKSIPPWWADFRKSLFAEMGDPATDAARHRRISPLFHAHRIKRPLLVVQGANDPRVLKAESDEIVAAVKKNGVPVEYLVFSDEGHGFLKRKNRIAASEAYVRFLERHLARRE